MMSLLTSHARGDARLELLQTFASELMDKTKIIGFKPSARGWGYILEQENHVTKDEFDTVERFINDCREKGILPLDFVAEEEARAFSGVEIPDHRSPGKYLRSCLNVPLQAEEHYGLDWWDGEQYYLQMVVEKIDLRTLFTPVCEEYHIPIANSKGWSSLLQRAEYARRFREAEQRGLKSVLLYCGDHDPPGLRISEFLRGNLTSISSGKWEDGTPGYDPSNLIIDRFGLNRDFIDKHGLTWIDNLITGSGRDL